MVSGLHKVQRTRIVLASGALILCLKGPTINAYYWNCGYSRGKLFVNVVDGSVAIMIYSNQVKTIHASNCPRLTLPIPKQTLESFISL